MAAGVARVGMMTAAFAVGQIARPLTVSLLAGSNTAFTVASIIGALALAIGNCLLSTMTRTDGVDSG